HVTLPIPKGGNNRKYKADLHSGAVLPTRYLHPSAAYDVCHLSILYGYYNAIVQPIPIKRFCLVTGGDRVCPLVDEIAKGGHGVAFFFFLFIQIRHILHCIFAPSWHEISSPFFTQVRPRGARLRMSAGRSPFRLRHIALRRRASSCLALVSILPPREMVWS